jgi:hypothetical protein
MLRGRRSSFPRGQARIKCLPSTSQITRSCSIERFQHGPKARDGRFRSQTPLTFSGEGETGLFKAEAFFARDGRLIKLCVVGEEGTTIDAEIWISAVTLAVSMGKMKMRPTSTREPPQNRPKPRKRAAPTDAIPVQ